MFTNKKELHNIQHRLNHIEANIDKVIWMLKKEPAILQSYLKNTIDESFVNQFESEVMSNYKKLNKKKKSYPKAFIACLKGRYKTIEDLIQELNLTESSVRTYLKLARKDGVQFNTRKINGKLSYKIRRV